MTGWMLGWVLDGSWVDFWLVLGPSWEVSWGQVGTKIQKKEVPRRCQKIITNLETRGYTGVPRVADVLAPNNTSILTGTASWLAGWQYKAL